MDFFLLIQESFRSWTWLFHEILMAFSWDSRAFYHSGMKMWRHLMQPSGWGTGSFARCKIRGPHKTAMRVGDEDFNQEGCCTVNTPRSAFLSMKTIGKIGAAHRTPVIGDILLKARSSLANMAFKKDKSRIWVRIRYALSN